MVKVACPDCQQVIDLDANLYIGQLVRCLACQTELEVTWLFPISLDYPEPKDSNPTYLRENFGHSFSGSETDTDCKLG
jgi:hypothetical protein